MSKCLFDLLVKLESFKTSMCFNRFWVRTGLSHTASQYVNDQSRRNNWNAKNRAPMLAKIHWKKADLTRSSKSSSRSPTPTSWVKFEKPSTPPGPEKVPWKQATPRQIRSVARSGCLAKKPQNWITQIYDLWGKGWVLCFDGIVEKSMTHVFGRSMFEKYSDSKPKVKEIGNFRPLNWLLKPENSWNYLWWGQVI